MFTNIFLGDFVSSFESTFAQANQSHSLYVVFLVFCAGFISSLTPCVYPLIPITLSIFGATGDIPRIKAFMLSLCYVLGISVTYTALGIFCAKTGMVFGSLLGNMYVVSGLTVLLFFLTLYTLEVVKFDFASRIQTKASQVGGTGYLGGFLMGTVSGLVAAPCTGPVLAVLLLYVAASHDTAWGGLLLFVYSIGLGMIFLALGTFSGLTKKIPKSGNWLHWVKFFMGVALVMVTFFVSQSLFKIPLTKDAHLIILIVLAAASIPLAALSYKKDIGLFRVLAALMLGVALFRLLVPQAGNAKSELVWLNSKELVIAEAQKIHKPILLDLFAEWCAACKEFEAVTFSDARVQEALGKLALGRVDFTEENEMTSKISEEYGVVGLPCLLFLDEQGKEIPGLRITGFMGPEEFLAHLKKVSAATAR